MTSYYIKVNYQPINGTWGVMLKKDNLVFNSVEETLTLAMNPVVDMIVKHKWGKNYKQVYKENEQNR